jgi:tetrahydromethanopterin S-methyltransferase subunit B
MPEPQDNQDEDMVARKVVYETRSASTTRGFGLTIGIIVVIALALVVWLVMQMR